jgi:DNA-binding IclR family transcriptional regulator
MSEFGSDPQKFVSAIGRGLDVLRVFEHADEWLGNGHIAERSGLPKSTVSRATYTLTQAHFLDLDPAEQKYRLGAAVLELAGRTASFESLRRVMRPHLQSLAQLSEGSAGAAFLSGPGLYYFEYHRSDAAVGLSLQVGSTIPVLGSAVGRAYLAAASDSERARLFEQAKELDPGSVAALQQFWREAVEEHQRDGFCRAYGTWKSQVNTIAVPYRVPASGLLVAISLAGPAFSHAADLFDRSLSGRLKTCLAAIDREFGRDVMVGG